MKATLNNGTEVNISISHSRLDDETRGTATIVQTGEVLVGESLDVYQELAEVMEERGMMAH